MKLTRRRLLELGGAGFLAQALPPFSPAAARGNDDEWPQYQGGPGHAGVSNDASVKPPFKLLWSYRLDGDASGDAGGGVTVGGGLVYVSVLNTRSLVALDAATGRLRWEFADSYPGYKDVPSYSDGRLILFERTRKPRVLALEAATGKIVWEHALRDAAHLPVLVRSGLAVDQGRIIVGDGGEEPTVTALDEKTGKPLWQAGLGKEVGRYVTPPSVARGTVFVATWSAPEARLADRGSIVALDAATGRELWRRTEVTSSKPLFTDGEVIACTLVVDRQFTFHLLDAKTGGTRWSLPTKFGNYTPPTATLTPKHVLVKPYGGRFAIVDRESGKQLGQFDGRTNSGCCTPAVAGEFAFMGTGVSFDRESVNAFRHLDAPRERGLGTSLHAVDLATGKSVWHFGTGNTICGDPAIAYGRLYFTSRDGRVYCFVPARQGEPTTPEARDASAPATAAEVQARLADRPASEAGWPMYGGTPARSGRPGLALKPPLAPAWKADLGGRVVCAAAIRDGRIFVGSDAGDVVALDAESGRRLWECSTGAPVRCSPATAGGLVYCGSDNGTFSAFDAASGKVKWTFACGGPVQASPATEGGVVVFGANDHHLYALDRETGRKLWAFRMRDYAIQAAPVVSGGQVFAGQWQDWVWAVDLQTGKEQWRSFVPVSIEAVAFYRNKLYVRSPYYIVELDPPSGKRLRIGTGSYGYGGPAFMGDLLFQSGVGGQYGYSGATSYDLSDEGRAMTRVVPTLEDVRMLPAKGIRGGAELASMVTPLVLGEAICFASRTGKLIVTDGEGKRLWTAALGGRCHSAPVAADNLLVVGCDDGHVYAFRGA